MSQLLNVVSSILSLSLLHTVCYVIEFYLLLYLWVLLVMRMLNGSVCASSWIVAPQTICLLCLTSHVLLCGFVNKITLYHIFFLRSMAVVPFKNW